MTLVTQIVGVAAVGLSVLGLSIVAFMLGGNPPIDRPELGSRGLKRHRALQARGPFFAIEPIVRFVAGWFRDFSLSKLRWQIDRKIVHAGDFMGLCADEVLALTLLTSVAFGVGGLVLCNVAVLPVSVALFAFGLGAMVPWSRIKNAALERGRKVNKALPGTVDLGALCMSAGLDFPGALRQIVATSPDKEAPIVEEFGRILQELELGYTRRRALESFADRVPTTPVQEFVNTVVQAEEKGNPLSDVLQIQARMQRMRRSIAIEEMASKASLQLLGPMMVIFMCVVTLLIAPVLIRYTNGGFN